MPKGLPSATQLLGREVTIFSIDTNIFQGFGFKFETGALNALRLQRPDWMRLRLPEVVAREVHSHRMAPVTEAVQRFDLASKTLAREAAVEIDAIEAAVAALNIVASSEARFEAELRRFVADLGGSILPISGATLGQDLFERYFTKAPPFEDKKDKKFEFPDAAALLLVEEFARSMNTMGILISADRGWEAFAHQSERLFCVKSLEDFTGLFQSTGAAAEQVKDKIRLAISNPTSTFSLMIEAELKSRLGESDWVVDDIYTGGPHRVDAQVEAIEVLGFSATTDPKVWFAADDYSIWIAELGVLSEVEADVSYAVYAWDSIDGHEVAVGGSSTFAQDEVSVDLLFTCRGRVDDPIETWEIESESATSKNYLAVGEVPVLGEEDYEEA